MPELGEGSFASLLCSFPDEMTASESKEPQDTEKTDDGNEKGLSAIYDPHVDVSGVDEAKLVRKIDRRLLPWLSFLHLLSFLDRTTIGNARVR